MHIPTEMKNAAKTPRHLLPKCVQDDLAGAERIRSGVLIAVLFVVLLSAIALVLRYADVINNWRP
jgi:cell division protein FtsL